MVVSLQSSVFIWEEVSGLILIVWIYLQCYLDISIYLVLSFLRSGIIIMISFNNTTTKNLLEKHILELSPIEM